MLRAKLALYEPEAPLETKRYFRVRLKDVLREECSEFERPSRLLVLSNISGNFKNFKRILLKAGVIDKRLNWIFEDGHLVILGNAIDPDERVTECLWLIYSLEGKAARSGGYVHFLLGAREIEHLNGNWRYTQPRYAENAMASSGPYTVLYDGNNELWRWICTKNIVLKIGSMLFVHGAFAGKVHRLALPAREINRLARIYYPTANIKPADWRIQKLFESLPEIQDNTFPDTALSHFNVKTLITGDEQMNGISVFHDGKCLNVNANHSDNNSEVLFIKGKRFYRISMTDPAVRIM